MAGAFGGAALLAAAAVVQAKAELAAIRSARMAEGPADRDSSA